jgi:chemotaxis methyl-accepting protein methylase
MLEAKAACQDRELKVWSAGCSVGLELLTILWLVEEVLNQMHEETKDWELHFIGTDQVKDALIEAQAISRKGLVNYKDNEQNITVTLNTANVKLDFLLLDHCRQDTRGDWVTWHLARGGFDIIFMRVTNLRSNAEQWAKSLLKKNGIFVGPLGLDSFRDEKTINTF